jgi:Regulator of chromosome condensation (RCC1) repeat
MKNIFLTFFCLFTSGLLWGQTPMSDILEISTMGDHTCVLTTKKVHCFGSNAYGQSVINTNFNNPRQLKNGTDHSCLIDDDGVWCWGDNRSGQSNPPVLNEPIKLALGSNFSCALEKSKKVICWGAKEILNQFPEKMENVTDISSYGAYGSNSLCLIINSKISCFGQTSTEELKNTPTNVKNPKNLSLNYGTACVSDQDQIICWGNYIGFMKYVPKNLKNIEKISVNSYSICITSDTGSQCYASPGTQLPRFKNIKLFDLNDHSCVVDEESIKCWGFDRSNSTIIPVKFSNLENLQMTGFSFCFSASEKISCLDTLSKQSIQLNYTGVKEFKPGYFYFCFSYENNINCKRTASNGVLDYHIPTDQTRFISTPSHDLFCYTDNQGAHCLTTTGGYEMTKLATPPLINPTEIATNSRNNACSLNIKNLVCWNYKDQPHHNSQYNRYVLDSVQTVELNNPHSLVINDRKACVIDSNRLRCFNIQTLESINDVPSDVKILNPLMISISGNYNCVIDLIDPATKTVKCWGKGVPESLPANIVNPRSVKALDGMSYLFDDTGLKLWGDTTQFESMFNTDL